MAVSFNSFKGRSNTNSVKIQGLAELNKSFDKLSKKSETELSHQIHIAANAIAKRANRDVPVDTGKLLRSIKVTRSKLDATVDARESYAGYVESGTRYMKKQPYFFKHVDPAIKMLLINVKRFITL